MDEKTNLNPSNPSSSDPAKTDLPKTEPKITFPSSPFSSGSPDIKPPESPNHLLSPDPTPSLKVDIESAVNQKPGPAATSFPETKKSGKLMLVLGMILLIIVTAGASGFAVYYYFSTQLQPLQKDKALLQSQVGNLKSQTEVLDKDKKNLQAEVTRLQTELEAQKTAATAPSTGDTVNAQPAPGGPVVPTPEAGNTPTQ